jgi:hypothetical protein
VVEEHEGTLAAVALEHRAQGDAVVAGIEEFVRDALLVEDFAEEIASEPLVAGRVRGIDAEVLAEEVDGLVVKSVPIGGISLVHGELPVAVVEPEYTEGLRELDMQVIACISCLRGGSTR